MPYLQKIYLSAIQGEILKATPTSLNLKKTLAKKPKNPMKLKFLLHYKSGISEFVTSKAFSITAESDFSR